MKRTGMARAAIASGIQVGSVVYRHHDDGTSYKVTVTAIGRNALLVARPGAAEFTCYGPISKTKDGVLITEKSGR